MDIIKLLATFALILFFLGRKKSFSLVMLGGAILVAVLFPMHPADFLLAYGKSVISRFTLELTFISWLVMLFEGVMLENKYMERILTAMHNMFHSKIVDIVSMPMVMGFLPSSGGALLSAPIVENATEGTGLSAERKTGINMHYRHVMEAFFPTYPGSIVACGISGILAGKFFIMMLPMGVFIFFIGLWHLRGRKNVPATSAVSGLWPRFYELLLALWPFLLLIFLITVFKLTVYWACLVALVLLLIVTRPKLRTLPRLVKQHTKTKLLLMIVTVLAFKDILAASGSLDTLPATISGLPLPPIIIFSLMVMSIAMITGIVSSSTAIVLPLMIVAIPNFTPSMVAIVHISSWIGAQLTPTHVCLPITAEYFQANLRKVLVQMLPIYAVVYAVALLYYGFLFV